MKNNDINEEQLNNFLQHRMFNFINEIKKCFV